MKSSQRKRGKSVSAPSYQLHKSSGHAVVRINGKIAIRYPDWGLFKVLNWKWVRFVGVLSYSFYLVHFVVIKILIATMPELGLLSTGLFSFVISVVISYGIFRFVETPAAKLKQKFSSH